MDRRHAIKNVALLLGGTLSVSTLSALGRWESSDFKLFKTSTLSLTDSQRKIVAEVAELIIPKTSTPGAKDAGVPAFIEMMLNDCYKSPEQISFVEGLKGLEAQNFLQKNAAEQTEILKGVEVNTKTMKSDTKGTPFWKLMKELTLLGYYTSEVGIKSSFDYEPIPGKLENIKIKPGQKSIIY